VKAGWTDVALGEVAALVRDVIEPSAIADGTLYVGLENIERGGAFANVAPVANGELASAKFTFDSSHILYGKLRPNLGKVARPQFAGVCSTDILPIALGPRIDRNYLAHFLLRPATVELAARRATGANLPRLAPTELMRFRLPLPPVDTQQRIARILDAAHTLVQQRSHSVTTLQTVVQSVFTEMFPSNGSGLTISLGDLVNPERPITYGILKPGPDIPDGVPYVRVVDIADGEIVADGVRRTTTTIASEYKRSVLAPGDLVMSIRGHVGRLAAVSDKLAGANITQDSARLAVRDFDPRYVMEAIRTPSIQRWMRRHVKGVAVQGINLADVKRIPIPAAALSAQREFAARAREADLAVTSARAHLRLLEVLFASLQHRAFIREL
jgi:type I restriction enzyme, S subunit